MWKKLMIQSFGLTCMLGLVSCDRVQDVVAEYTGNAAPKERRAGIERVHSASPSDVKMWLAEPNVLVVLDFYSGGCPICVAMSPTLDKLAKQHSDKVAIMKLDVGQPGETAKVATEEYQINQTPVLKFYLNGKEIKTLEGAQSDEDLAKVFEKLTSRISDKKEYVMREGEMPGQEVRTIEDMMKRMKRGELPEGMTRTKVPSEENDLTASRPDRELNKHLDKPTKLTVEVKGPDGN